MDPLTALIVVAIASSISIMTAIYVYFNYDKRRDINKQESVE